MKSKFLFIMLFLLMGCHFTSWVHTGDVLNLDPKNERLLNVQTVNKSLDNYSGKSADELIASFIQSYNAQNNTNFTAFIANEPIDTSRQRVTLNGILVETR